MIELKKGSVSIVDGIAQLISNQSAEYNPGFFTTAQILLAANNSEGLRYGTIGTPAKHYLPWKEAHPAEQGYLMDIQLGQIFPQGADHRAYAGFRDFRRGTQKLPRPHQYFAIKAAQEAFAKKIGGIIWHSQGSGKSLVMVLLARWLLENNPQARVLVVTDRIELDSQIERVFRDAEENRVRHIAFGNDLLPVLESHEHRLMCALIHKFGSKGAQGGEFPQGICGGIEKSSGISSGELFRFCG